MRRGWAREFERRRDYLRDQEKRRRRHDMALVGSTTIRRDIPHEPGHWMEFRQLPWKQLETAQRAVMTKAQGQTRAAIEAMGGDAFNAFQKTVAEMTKDKPEDDTPKKPADGYDGETLLRLSLVAWSYDEAVSPDSIGDLDPVTFEWAVDEAATLSNPRETADARKNGLQPSSSI